MAAIRETEMFCIPLLHLLLVRGFEEDTADAEDSSMFVFLFCDGTGAPFCAAMEREGHGPR